MCRCGGRERVSPLQYNRGGIRGKENCRQFQNVNSRPARNRFAEAAIFMIETHLSHYHKCPGTKALRAINATVYRLIGRYRRLSHMKSLNMTRHSLYVYPGCERRIVRKKFRVNVRVTVVVAAANPTNSFKDVMDFLCFERR